LNYIIAGLAVVIVVATILPHVPRDEWWIRDFDFPRVQIATIGGALIVAFPFVPGFDNTVKVAIFVALIAAVLYQLRRIFPYTRLAPHEVLPAENPDPKASIAVLVANVLMTNRESGRLLAIIEGRDPDIVLLLEPDAQWQADMRPLERKYPQTVHRPLDNTYGILLYSRLELIEPSVAFLIEDDIPSIHTRVRLESRQIFWLHCVHPEPPSPTEASESTDRDAELLVVGKTVEERGEPAIVCGDLNDVAWSVTTSLFQKVSELLDLRKGRGMFSTFHAKIPFMRWPLDHIFVSEHFRFEEMRRLEAFGSDHFPVYARVSLEPERKEEQDKPEADPNDQERAREKVNKAATQRDD
jgi:endonuclease/exonuclease/phosphatase (EEP) superfamily protein YafD